MRWWWLLVLLPPAVWLTARLLKAGRPIRDTAEQGRDDPERRRALEDELRRRRDGSGPTVGGGQHLG